MQEKQQPSLLTTSPETHLGDKIVSFESKKVSHMQTHYTVPLIQTKELPDSNSTVVSYLSNLMLDQWHEI